MSKVIVESFRPVYPTPAALITSVSADGHPNIITLGEAFNIGLANPAIVGIAIRKERYSHALISESREFVVNLPSIDIIEATDWCGTHGGMADGKRVDKFAATGLTPVPASKVRPPLIAECPVNIECILIAVHEVGDHDLFLGEVTATHADESVLNEAGRLDPDKVRGFCLMLNLGSRGEYRAIGKKLSNAWFTGG